jgi:hypothetical protein
LDMGVKQGTVSNTLHEVIPKIVAKAGDWKALPAILQLVS